MGLTKQEIADWALDLGVERFEGQADFLFANEIPVSVALSDDGQEVLFSAQIGALPQDAETDRLRSLLAAGHLGLETHGAALSLAPDGETLTLWRVLRAAALDRETLESDFGVFLQTAERLRPRVVAGAPEAAAQAGLREVRV